MFPPSSIASSSSSHTYDGIQYIGIKGNRSQARHKGSKLYSDKMQQTYPKLKQNSDIGIRYRKSQVQRGRSGIYEVFVDNVALEVVVPAIVQVLLPDQISDVYMAEIGGLRQSSRRRRLASPGSPRHQYVGPLSLAGVSSHR
ncbi:hypothetical protein V6N11_000991 [Hibiscus sabdariffa]|uniref:Uncharacterized protein n=1 Tax=Hibiscus sabdariffa TaxID=183260 RepID=A0ABR2RYE8_9ROSI